MKIFSSVCCFVCLFFYALISVVSAEPAPMPVGASAEISGTSVSPQYIIVDDYAGESVPGRLWYYSRIGTDRGEMGSGTYTVHIGGGSASVNVTSLYGWAGVWCSLQHNAASNHVLNPTQLLGPYIKSQYQPHIVGIEVDISDGSGQFKLELKDINNSLVAVRTYLLTSGATTITANVTPTTNLARLNWLIDGPGHATVEEVRLVIGSPAYSVTEAVFLFSYGHLSQCYDAATGLVRDRARWPVTDFASVQTIGTFALINAIAWDRGYVEETTARTIITTTKNTLLNLPRYHGLLPHFIKNGAICENTEWSSVDTVIALIAEILACQAMGEDTSALQTMLQGIDWNDLTDNGTHSIGMGYDYSGNKLAATWNTFGAEAFLMATAYASATGSSNVSLDNFSYPPTWDGSGFNDEMASLFFPMDGIDMWGNDWAAYRQAAFNAQNTYFAAHSYGTLGLFGLSASEVPESWAVAEDDVYAAWGVGGHNGAANDGTTLVGYPIIAPHYAAMIATRNPSAFETVFRYLMETKNIFTPLNNVESFGIAGDGSLRWNSLKGSWNLSLQALGAGRALYSGDYLTYCAFSQNSFLYQGVGLMEERTLNVTAPNGGEEWRQGTTQTITWTAVNLSGNVDIQLYDGAVMVLDITDVPVENGSYDWIIPTDLVPGDAFKIRISQQGLSDDSDSVFSIVAAYSSATHPDFNGDGHTDLLWRHTVTGENGTWLMDGTVRTGIVFLNPLNSDWESGGTADFNEDGKTDIMWRHKNSGQNGVWMMDGTVRTQIIFLPTLSDMNWKCGGLADFNGDGKPDILWRNQVTGQNGVWMMNGTVRTGITFLPTLGDTDWKCDGVGDFNNDGKPDIFWRHSVTGENAVWFMDGVVRTGNAYLKPLTDMNWKCGGLGDFNNDGKPDIFWRHRVTGQNGVWFMDGTTRTYIEFLNTLSDTAWELGN